MSGLVLVTLTDKEIVQLSDWYLAHYLAEENTLADDQLAERLTGLRIEVSCTT